MTTVKEIMKSEARIPRIESTASILEAAEEMNKIGATGAVVYRDDQAVGILTERSLLRRFVPLNRRPSSVTVGQVMGPLLRVSENASVEDVGRRLIDLRITRLGVFRDSTFIGWVTITDVARAESKKRGILHRFESEEGMEIVCPQCKSGAFKEVMGADGQVLRWRCDRCGYEQ